MAYLAQVDPDWGGDHNRHAGAAHNRKRHRWRKARRDWTRRLGEFCGAAYRRVRA